MTMKPEAYGVTDTSQNQPNAGGSQGKHRQDPLSGSKKVKNRNHSRDNQQSEGSGHGH